MKNHIHENLVNYVKTLEDAVNKPYSQSNVFGGDKTVPLIANRIKDQTDRTDNEFILRDKMRRIASDLEQSESGTYREIAKDLTKISDDSALEYQKVPPTPSKDDAQKDSSSIEIHTAGRTSRPSHRFASAAASVLMVASALGLTGLAERHASSPVHGNSAHAAEVSAPHKESYPLRVVSVENPDGSYHTGYAPDPRSVRHVDLSQVKTQAGRISGDVLFDGMGKVNFEKGTPQSLSDGVQKDLQPIRGVRLSATIDAQGNLISSQMDTSAFKNGQNPFLEKNEVDPLLINGGIVQPSDGVNKGSASPTYSTSARACAFNGVKEAAFQATRTPNHQPVVYSCMDQKGNVLGTGVVSIQNGKPFVSEDAGMQKLVTTKKSTQLAQGPY